MRQNIKTYFAAKSGGSWAFIKPIEPVDENGRERPLCPFGLTKSCKLLDDKKKDDSKEYNRCLGLFSVKQFDNIINVY